MDQLYIQILNSSFQDLNPSERTDLNFILAAIVLAKDPLSPDDLQSLIGPAFFRSRSFLGELSPVVPLSDSWGGERYQVCHTSFHDFILDDRRSGRLGVNASLCNARIANACLEWLNNNLRFNISSTHSSYHSRRDEKDSPFITGPFRYASKFWVEHLCESTITTESIGIIVVMKAFFDDHFLSWLEIMSYLEASRSVPGLLRSLGYWMTVSVHIRLLDPH